MAKHRAARTEVSSLSASRMALALVLGGVLVLGAWWLLRSKPAELSGIGYELTSALYTACNLEDAKRLETVAEKVNELSLATAEREAVMSIVALAKGGQWQDAAASARRLLEAQDNR